MKVLHICQHDDAAGGGAVRVAVEIAKRQIAHEIEAKCVFIYGKPGAFGQELGGNAIYLQNNDASQRVLAAWRFYQMLQAERPDIIHHHDGVTWTHLLSQLSTAKIRVGHGHLTAPAPNARRRHRLAGFVHAKTYDHLFCVSEYVAQTWRLSGYPSEKLEVIPNGVDTDKFMPPSLEQSRAARFTFGIPEEAIVFCFVGRLHNEVKRCDDFIRTVASMPEHVWGLIAGTGVDESALRQLASNLQISHRIRFVGLQDPPTPCYHASDVLLMTSCYEPFGLVVLEAAACGVAVAGFSSDGGVNDLMKSIHAPILSSREPAELGQLALSLLNEDPERLSSLRELVCENYSWNQIVKKIVDRYSKLLNDS